jgi:hypothetical protein
VMWHASRYRCWPQAWLLAAGYSWRQLVLAASACHHLELLVRTPCDTQLNGTALRCIFAACKYLCSCQPPTARCNVL